MLEISSASRAASPVALIAHRGASGYAPENTASAFARCLRMGARAIEFDVQRTRDGRLVVLHDADLKRVAGVRRRVRGLAWPELSLLDVGAWFSPEFRGERVPLLEETLDLIEREAPGRVELQLEIKQPFRPYAGIEKAVLEALSARPAWAGRVVVSSFHHPTLHRVRALDPGMRLGYLAGLTPLKSALREAAGLGCESVHQSLRRVDRAWVDGARRAGMRVFVYTVNAPEDLARMRALGVDAVFTNYPDLGEPGR